MTKNEQKHAVNVFSFRSCCSDIFVQQISQYAPPTTSSNVNKQSILRAAFLFDGFIDRRCGRLSKRGLHRNNYHNLVNEQQFVLVQS